MSDKPDRTRKVSEEKRITPNQAKNGATGYCVICISVYGADVRMMERLMERTGMNRSALIRAALYRLDEATRPEEAIK